MSCCRPPEAQQRATNNSIVIYSFVSWWFSPTLIGLLQKRSETNVIDVVERARRTDWELNAGIHGGDRASAARFAGSARTEWRVHGPGELRADHAWDRAAAQGDRREARADQSHGGRDAAQGGDLPPAAARLRGTAASLARTLLPNRYHNSAARLDGTSDRCP